MSMSDFMVCTPSEFYAAWRAWSACEERRERVEWERMRMVCLCSLQPYSKSVLKATDVMRFSWDEQEVSKGDRVDANDMSREEILSRYKKLAAARGLR